MSERENIDRNIQEIVDCIREYREETDRLETRINGLKEELRVLLEERGESWSDATGFARLLSEGERVYYDREALDRMIIEDPLRYGWLKDYRITSPIQGRVQVR
jgi:chromosome segregation ATPase